MKTEKELIEIARDEITKWHGLPDGLVLMILFCFVRRVVTDLTFEEEFLGHYIPDYQI